MEQEKNDLIDIPRDDFKNEMVLDMITMMVQHRQSWRDNKSGHAWKRIIFVIAEQFPEDRAVIHEMFRTQGEPVKSSGRAKIHSGKKPHAKQAVEIKDDCPDCPKGQQKSRVANKLTITKGSGGQGERKRSTGKDFSGMSVAEIREAFEDSEIAMNAYCSGQGIEVGRAKSAEGVAKKIYEHFNPDEDENED